jgi:hypothetical protein
MTRGDLPSSSSIDAVNLFSMQPRPRVGPARRLGNGVALIW